MLALWLLACFSPTEVITLDYDAERSEIVSAGLLINGFNEAGICHVMWLNGEGEILWEVDCEPDQRIFRIKESRDGNSILYATSRVDKGLYPEGSIVRATLTGQQVTTTPTPLIHHDFNETATGFEYISYVEEGLLVEDRWAELATDAVLEVPEGGGPEVSHFDYLSDYPLPPFWSCIHMGRKGWLPEHNEWTHTNSLVQHPTDDAWLLMPRYWDAIIKVDKPTGEVLWELGGENDQFGLADEDSMSHPHMSHAFDDRILVFDNGSGHGELKRTSRVIEYQIDEENLTAEVVWEYVSPDGNITGFLGDAKRLPGGNTLIVWSSDGRLTEVTPEGDIVWELTLPYGQNTGRVEVTGLKLP